MNAILPKLCYWAFGLKFPLSLLYLAPVLIFFPGIKRLFKNNLFRILFILIPPTLFFIKLVRNDPFFLSDDFAHLNMVFRHSYLEIARMAILDKIWVEHHIFTAFWLFKFIFRFFGTKPEAYLFVNYILQFFNLVIFYKCLEKLKKGSFISVFVTFILGFYYLTWISNMHEILGGTFLLLSLYYWIKYIKAQAKLFWVIGFYVLAIISKEVAFIGFPAILLFTIYYHFNVRKLKFEKYALPLLSLFLIFVFYIVLYVWRFIAYSDLPVDEGYKIAFSLSVFVKNIILYTSMAVPALNNSYVLTLLFFSLFAVFDIWKKKPFLTPFLVSYLMFLTPPSLFTNRISNYYIYIPSFFLFIGFAVLFWELSRLKLFPHKIVTSFTLFLIMYYVFGVGRLLMDNCFLIQYPWQKPFTQAFYSVRDRVESLYASGKLKEGTEIKLTSEEKTPDMQALYETDSLGLFTKGKRAGKFSFIYNKDRGILEVKEK